MANKITKVSRCSPQNNSETVTNELDNKPSQPSKFRTKNWVEINDDSHGVCNTGSQIRFKTSI